MVCETMTSVQEVRSPIADVEYRVSVKAVPPKIVLKHVLEEMEGYDVFTNSVVVERGGKRVYIEFHSMNVNITSNDYDGLMKVLKIMEDIRNIIDRVIDARAGLAEVYINVKYHGEDVNELIRKYDEARKIYECARSIGYRDEHMESLLENVGRWLMSRNIGVNVYDEERVDEYTRWGE